MAPYRTADRRRNARSREAGFGFRSATLRHGDERFELALWDHGPTLCIGMLLLTVGPVAAWACWLRLSVGVLLALGTLLLVSCVTARKALVVTKSGAWAEQRILGATWRRRPLGRSPRLESGLGYDWNELAAIPTNESLRPPFDDEQRFVLAEWGLSDGRKDRDAVHIAAIANREIVRLHA